MDNIKTLWPPKGRAAVIAWSGAGLAALLGVVAASAWPALVRPEPPLEAADGEGVRISLVEPPKAAPPRVSPLDVGLSEAALAMANGRQAVASAWSSEPPPRPAPVGRAPAAAPALTTPLQVEDDRAQPVRPEEVDDRWSRDRDGDRYEAAERRRWETERLVEEERAERRALRRAERQRELDRWDDRDAPRDDDAAPPPDDRPPPRW